MPAKIDGTNGLIQQYDYQVLTTAFSYTFAAGTTVLVIQPAGTLATGTITMPAAPADGMTISISSTQEITALTINGNSGQSIVGKPTTLIAGGAVTFVYRLANTTWFTQTSTATSTAANVQNFATTGTWTKPANKSWVKIRLWGGGGGPCRGTTGQTGGGGGGAYNEITLPIENLAATMTVTVATGGTAATTNNGTGGTGGTSTITIATAYNGRTVFSAPGGVGGSFDAVNVIYSGGAGGGNGFSASDSGGSGGTHDSGGNAAGSSYWGGGGGGAGSTATGSPPGKSTFGGGGGSGSAAAAGSNSLFGGNGGAIGAAGSVPGGGGGASASTNTTGGAGGAGYVTIISW